MEWRLFFVECIQHVQYLCLVRNSNFLKLGHGVEVRACFPTFILVLFLLQVFTLLTAAIYLSKGFADPLKYALEFFLFSPPPSYSKNLKFLFCIHNISCDWLNILFTSCSPLTLMCFVLLRNVVLDTFNNVSRNEDKILDQIHICKQICSDFNYEDLKF